MNFLLSLLMIVIAGQSNAYRDAPYLAERMDGMLVLNCAVGGSSITEWQRGQQPYEDCIARVRSYQGQGYSVQWVMFMQGERDSLNAEIAHHWAGYFYKFVNSFREDAAPGVPVVFGQLGKLPGDVPRPYWHTVREQQEIAGGRPSLTMFRTWDIEPYCTGPHYCPAGYDLIAQRAVHQFKLRNWAANIPGD